jgi:uncharacterized protein YbjT (DUF2867 family)
VALSSGAVTGGFDTDFHFPVERAVEDSRLKWTHVRPGEFMLNKLWLWGPSIRAESVVYNPFPTWRGVLYTNATSPTSPSPHCWRTGTAAGRTT